MYYQGVNFEHPVGEIRQYNLQNLPAAPNIQVPNDAQAAVLPVTMFVINESGAYAGRSPARMALYNLLAENGWKNPFFDEVVRLCVDVVLFIQRGGQSLAIDTLCRNDASYSNIVKQILTLHASDLVLRYPEIRAVTAQNVAVGAASNMEMFQRVQQAVQALYPNQAPAHQTYQGRPRSAGVVAPLAPPITQGRPSAIRTSPPAPQTKRTAPADNAELIIGEIENMDRNQHSIVYFGSEYPMPMKTIREEYARTVAIHEEIAEKTAPELNYDSPYVCMDHILICDNCVALAKWTRVSYYALEDDTAIGIYTTFGGESHQVVSKTDFSTFFQELGDKPDFVSIAKAMKAFLEPYRNDPMVLRNALSFISQIDRILTNMVNEFLRNALGTEIVIGSFTEDIPDLLPFLNKKYENAYNNAYIAFQSTLLGLLFKYNSSIEAEDNKNYSSYYLTELYSLTYINASAKELGYNITRKAKTLTKTSSPLLHRLLTALKQTHLTLENTLLRHIPNTVYDATTDKPLELPQPPQPAFRLKNDIPCRPVKHLLITNDDAYYYVYQSLNDPDDFILMEY